MLPTSFICKDRNSPIWRVSTDYNLRGNPSYPFPDLVGTQQNLKVRIIVGHIG